MPSSDSKSPPPEPSRMTKLPSVPSKEFSVDTAGPFRSLYYIMVATDEYSRFPEAELLTSTFAKAVVPKLDAIFARQRVPDIVKSDNGPPFNGHEFEDVANYLGFKHRRITPYRSKAKGEAKRLVQTLEKTILSGLLT